MHIFYDEDEFEIVTDSRPCTTCASDMRKCSGVGCNGSFAVGSRRRTPDEVRAIKAAKRKEYEDAILAEADAIRARRAQQTQELR